MPCKQLQSGAFTRLTKYVAIATRDGVKATCNKKMACAFGAGQVGAIVLAKNEEIGPEAAGFMSAQKTDSGIAFGLKNQGGDGVLQYNQDTGILSAATQEIQSGCFC